MSKNDNVVNFPVVDNRTVEFAEKLEEFVYANGRDIPLISIVGALETVKLLVLGAVTGD